MKKFFLTTASALLLLTLSAQDSKTEKEEKPRKLKDQDEIIIKRKDADKDKKITIEIKDDEVFIDGKPLDDYKDADITVRQRGPLTFTFRGSDSPFRGPRGAWSFDSDDFDENKPFLGVTSEGSTDGVKITMISENSAAAKAGLQKGDIITKINDKAVFDHEQLSEAIGKYKPEEKITVTYKRDGKENKVTAVLGKRPLPNPPFPPMAPDAPGAPEVPPIPRVMPFDMDGNDFGELFPHRDARPKLGIKVQDTEDGKGVKVLDVETGSAAEKAGIKKDDVITSFEGKEVSGATDLARASKDAAEKSSVKVQLNRNGKSQSIDVKIPKKLKTANL